MSKSDIKTIGITMGDPCGIGAEVIAKAISKNPLKQYGRFVIIGDKKIFSRYLKTPLAGNWNFLDLNNVPGKFFHFGHSNSHNARASLDYIDKAIGLLKDKVIIGLVTAPVSKESITSLGVKFEGHTEYLAQHFHPKRFGMMFVADRLKTVVITRHIPLKKISSALNAKNIYETIFLTCETLKRYFKIRYPKIAVCGLNPHAGEGTLLGDEEVEVINPAIRKARTKNIDVRGPFSPDTIFYPANAKAYDAIVAMYHDQGLIPIKTLYFNRLVNLTMGLPFVRTSPAHGTAFDIAGKNKADPSSMSCAIELAARLCR